MIAAEAGRTPAGGRTMTAVVNDGTTFIQPGTYHGSSTAGIINLVNFSVGVSQQQITNIIDMLVVILPIVSDSLIGCHAHSLVMPGERSCITFILYRTLDHGGNLVRCFTGKPAHENIGIGVVPGQKRETGIGGTTGSTQIWYILGVTYQKQEG